MLVYQKVKTSRFWTVVQMIFQEVFWRICLVEFDCPAGHIRVSKKITQSNHHSANVTPSTRNKHVDLWAHKAMYGKWYLFEANEIILSFEFGIPKRDLLICKPQIFTFVIG